MESAMTDLIPSQFVSPSSRPELNGELGLDLHEIAKSLGAEFKHVKAAYEKNINDYSGVEYSASSGNPVNPFVQSYVLSVEDAKFFVAGYNNEVGKAYRRWLIQCEKKLDQTNLLIKQIMSDEVICRRVLQLADEKLMKVTIERDQALKTKAEISSRREATALAKLSFKTAMLKEMEEVNDSLKNQLGEGKEVKLAIGWKKVFPKFERFTDSVLGRKLSAISKANSIEITEVPHVVYGKINAYHLKACQLLNESLPELQLNPTVTYI
jgi:phage anti-repressor protein